jgi:SAM-dependent methyltransferase
MPILKHLVKLPFKAGFFVLEKLVVLLGIARPISAQSLRHQMLESFFLDQNMPKTASTLDVGCGDGRFLGRLHQLGYVNLYGCDWRDNVEAVEFEYRKVDLDTEGLQTYPPESFDVVICSDVIEHLENPSQLIRNIHRVLRRGGVLFITFPNCANVFQRFHFLMRGNCGRYMPHVYGPHGHISMLPSWVFEYLIRDYFDIVQLSGDGAVWRNRLLALLPRTPLWTYAVFYLLSAK